jgi:hypothetical protein
LIGGLLCRQGVVASIAHIRAGEPINVPLEMFVFGLVLLDNERDPNAECTCVLLWAMENIVASWFVYAPSADP